MIRAFFSKSGKEASPHSPFDRNIKKLFWMLAAAWTFTVGVLVVANILDNYEVQREMALHEAVANFNKDQAFRQWAASHGGVYVPATKKTPSNPFLASIPERDIITPSGKHLTLMNPAYMLRQTMEFYEAIYGVKGHIVGIRHFRPETKPDKWELTALLAFEEGSKQEEEYTEINGKPYLRLMRPFYVQPSCLKCHGHQGYKVGQVRGGVSVAIPLKNYLAAARRQNIVTIAAFMILWILGLGGLTYASATLRKTIDEKEKAIDELRAAKIAEEERVKREKLQAALQTAGAVCHEMNQPLQIILSMAEAALEDIDPSHPAHQDLQNIHAGAEEMAKITKKLSGITSFETKNYVDDVHILDLDKSSGD